MFCSNCGQKSDGNFCSACGKRCSVNIQYQPPQTSYLQRTPVMDDNFPGTNFLTVTGILFIIFGIFGTLFSSCFVFTYDFFGELYNNVGRDLWQLTWIFEVARALFGIFIGIMGIKFARKLDKAAMLKILVAIYAAITMGIFVFDIVIGITNVWGVVFLPFALIVPILYFVGAQKNDSYNRNNQ